VSTQDYASWIGRSRSMTDVILPAQAVKLAATLDCAPPPLTTGDPLPPGWHWCYFHEVTPLSGIGRDGHQALGEFLPPVDLPRRMWAAGDIEITQPLSLGETVEKVSTIEAVDEKQGRTGKLVFVRVSHRLTGSNGADMREVHQIVYREAPAADAPAPPPQMPPHEAEWSRDMTAGPVQLFRYSALTFNSHRIHYDVDFCRNEEGYDGLIIHGPLTATMLMEVARELEPARALKAFSFRAVSPLTHVHPFSLHARHTEDGMALWACNHRGELAMTANASLI
jgi:3-methylfumaryl-CoA hydratase